MAAAAPEADYMQSLQDRLNQGGLPRMRERLRNSEKIASSGSCVDD